MKLIILSYLIQAISVLGTSCPPQSQILDWNKMPGLLKQISIGSDGTIMGVNIHLQIFRWNGDDWSSVNPNTGRLLQVSVGNANNIWGVSENDAVFKWNDNNWSQVDPTDGRLKQVSVGSDGTVWGVNANHELYKYSNNYLFIDHGFSQISVGSASNICGIQSGKVYKLNVPSSQATADNIGQWTHIPGPPLFKYVDISADGDMWAIDTNNNIYRYICESDGSGYWLLVSSPDGQLTQIESNNGIVVGVNSGSSYIFKATDKYPKCKSIISGSRRLIMNEQV